MCGDSYVVDPGCAEAMELEEIQQKVAGGSLTRIRVVMYQL